MIFPLSRLLPHCPQRHGNLLTWCCAPHSVLAPSSADSYVRRERSATAHAASSSSYQHVVAVVYTAELHGWKVASEKRQGFLCCCPCCVSLLCVRLLIFSAVLLLSLHCLRRANNELVFVCESWLYTVYVEQTPPHAASMLHPQVDTSPDTYLINITPTSCTALPFPPLPLSPPPHRSVA